MRSSLVLRRTVGSWGSGTRVVVRREDGQALVVSPIAQPAVELEVLVVDVVRLRRRSSNTVVDRVEARATLSRQIARVWVRLERVVHVLERS